jgi:hypothetical protein
MLAIKIEIVWAMTTADPPKTAAPVQLTTPPDVYALGMYWRSRLRGVDREMTTAARKKEKYRRKLRNMNAIAGRVGLKDGVI